jgi:hypothetical protein
VYQKQTCGQIEAVATSTGWPVPPLVAALSSWQVWRMHAGVCADLWSSSHIHQAHCLVSCHLSGCTAAQAPTFLNIVRLKYVEIHIAEKNNRGRA